MVFNEEDKEKIDSFLKEHIDGYTKGHQEFFRNVYQTGSIELFDIVGQIYTYLFGSRYSHYPYEVFFDYLMWQFPNLAKKKIVEVASGYIPGVSMHIKNRVNMRYPITCIDPLSLNLEYSGIISRRELFTEDTDIADYGLIIAHAPCEALDAIVQKTIADKKELCVQTCRCSASGSYNDFEFHYLIDYLLDALYSLEDDGFLVDCENTEIAEYVHAPVITVRKRKLRDHFKLLPYKENK